MSSIVQSTFRGKSRNLAHSVTCLMIMGVLLTILLIHFASAAASADQTREQCDKCCKSSQQDEYYLEQCKLKCFRNPEHCAEQKGRREAAPGPAEPPAPPAAAQQRTPAPLVEPAQPPLPAQPRVAEPPRPARQKPPSRTEVVLPNPLNLVPGREWEAAGQILAANGISPQNPQYQAGLKSIEAVLIEFARANPGGGKLSTPQLEKIIRQLR